MKKLLTLAVALVALAAFADLGVAQQKGEERSRPTGVEMKQPATGLGTAQQKGVEKSPAMAQMCSKAKMEVLDRLRAVEACDKAEKQRRVNEAKNCRGALKTRTFPPLFIGTRLSDPPPLQRVRPLVPVMVRLPESTAGLA